MQLDQYLHFWGKAKPLMIEKLTNLRDILQPGFTLVIEDPSANEDTEEFRVSMGMLDGQGNFILFVETTLLDCDENGAEEGVGISTSITSFNSLGLGSFSPFNYTEDAFTTDVDEMEDRINMLDEHQAAEFIKTDVMHNATLQREYVETYQTPFPQ
jgi:hypothetical protein